MNTPIDIDRLQQAWQMLDRRLDRQDAMLLQQARRSSIQTIRRRLRPLAWGQATQMLLGLGLVLMSVPVWSTFRSTTHVFAAGVVLHAYGLASILLGGITLGGLSRLDYGSPVMALQKRLLGLQRLYVAGSTALGLAWWLLWIPFAIVAFAWIGVDFGHRVAPAMPWMVGGGIAGLGATLAFHRWASRRPALHARLRRSMAGPGLSAATAEIDALRKLETEGIEEADGAER